MKFNKFSSSKKSTTLYSYKEVNNLLDVYPENSLFPISNSSFGTMYEDSILIKSILNLPIKAIQDPNVFTEDSRKIKGLKLIVMPTDEKFKKNYIEDSLENGEFKVIPFANIYFNVSYNGNSNKIKYWDDEIIFKKGEIIYDSYDLRYEEKKSPKNIFEGFIYIDKYKNYKLYIFSFCCEVDGLFQVDKDIYSYDFKSYIIYSCQKNSTKNLSKIPKDSIIVYEIKSGNDLQNLIIQIIKKCHFLEAFFNCLPLYKNRQLFLIGFNRYKEFRFGNYHYDYLQQKNINCLLLDVRDEIFGEKIYCNYEDINMLRLLKDKIQNTEKDVKEIKETNEKLEKEIKEMKNDFNSKLNLILERLPSAQVVNNNNGQNNINNENV